MSGPIPGNRHKLFTFDELLRAIRGRSPDCEVVVTGRRAPQELIQGSAALQSCQGGDHGGTEDPLGGTVIAKIYKQQEERQRIVLRIFSSGFWNA